MGKFLLLASVVVGAFLLGLLSGVKIEWGNFCCWAVEEVGEVLLGEQAGTGFCLVLQ